MQDSFWKNKKINDMSLEEREALCDRCGLCCLHKLEDEDTGEIYYTQVACKLLNLSTCECTSYSNRHEHVPICLDICEGPDSTFAMLPPTCAYRLLFEGKELPKWHYLVSGDLESVHDEKVSVKNRVLSENDIDMNELDEYIIYQI